MDAFALLIAALGASTLWILFKFLTIGRRESFLPPGPPTVPILGNILSFPTTHPWYKLTDMAREYGDIYSLKIASGTVVVLSSVTAVREVLEKNSSVVSDRPANHIVNEIFGEKNMGLARYGDTWRRHRRCAQEGLSLQACRSHLNIQQAEATQLMYDILTKPQICYDAIQRYSISVVLSIFFGQRVSRLTTPEMVDLLTSFHGAVAILEPGAHPPLDLIPILKMIPERWASWKTATKTIKQLHRKVYLQLMKKIERRLNQGDSTGCFIEKLIEKMPTSGMDSDDIRELGATIIGAGTDTTASLIESLVLALVNFPEAQRLAQEEIDRVVGDERPPLLDDIERLPYIQAVIKETIRWRPGAPIALPHASIQDVSYNGYVIPKGSTVIQNTWAIFHDPDVFKDPSAFNPGRWLTDELVSDRTCDLLFGSGRRVCPGVHLARNSININAMNLIWGFKFSKSKDPFTGQEKIYDLLDYSRGILTNPNRFECAAEVRSAHRAELIKRNLLEACIVFEPLELDLREEDKAILEKMRLDIREDLHL